MAREEGKSEVLIGKQDQKTDQRPMQRPSAGDTRLPSSLSPLQPESPYSPSPPTARVPLQPESRSSENEPELAIWQPANITCETSPQKHAKKSDEKEMRFQSTSQIFAKFCETWGSREVIRFWVTFFGVRGDFGEQVFEKY